MLFNFMKQVIMMSGVYHRIYLYKLGAEKFSIGSVICTEISWRVDSARLKNLIFFDHG